jgi:hypothetical protein
MTTNERVDSLLAALDKSVQGVLAYFEARVHLRGEGR